MPSCTVSSLETQVWLFWLLRPVSTTLLFPKSTSLAKLVETSLGTGCPLTKGLGGSSIINFLGLFRPSKQEMDALENLGNPELGVDVSSHAKVKYAAQPKKDLHGSEGPLKKSFPTLLTKLHSELFDAAEFIGIPRNPETSSGINLGATTSLIAVALPCNEDNGLHRATGVELVKDGVTSVVRNIRGDVVLAAGSFQTPQILELSGIGNPDILGKYGIQTLAKTWDHIGVSTIVEVETTDLTTDLLLTDPVAVKEHLEL
ncbi:hypothetical protein BT96DRAFT_1024822 [Gymnopus androsaceus JB14]|uniref:Glucose-methanol-choline oxidoreductase N-terminal domain-containing protein n=1 Tax=Gymnopus androsaceus JB14 TaxID=1447944 RepID=A0A6A4GVM8_9AGAR|nr:hypothetical protein BT96DRAFT_1024822 [Gymnopus androsaceus JB14]